MRGRMMRGRTMRGVARCVGTWFLLFARKRPLMNLEHWPMSVSSVMLSSVRAFS